MQPTQARHPIELQDEEGERGPEDRSEVETDPRDHAERGDAEDRSGGREAARPPSWARQMMPTPRKPIPVATAATA
jgi:hypothetical protein